MQAVWWVAGWVGGLDSDKHTTLWPILQAETFQIFSQAEISRQGRVWQLLRYEYRNLKKMHKPIDENAVPILRQKKGFTIQNGEVKFQRNQFPLTLSYAITSFKCQGDTLQEVIIDFEHDPGEIRNVPCGSFYVALTRVKEGKHVFLRSFKENYITYNKRVEEKIESMRKFKEYSFKKVYVNDTI